MRRIIPHIIFLLSLLAVGIRIWVAEDAYITFRIIENLYSGIGLVYNAGERVEAFTHPLWAMILIIIKGMGLPLHSGAVMAGLLLSMFSLGLLIYGKNKNEKAVFPFAVLILISISGFRDFATAGMELSLLFFLLTIFYSTLSKYKLIDAPSFFSALLALIYLTRPELAIMYIWYGAFFLYELLKSSGMKNSWQKIFKPALFWAVPSLLWIGGYHAFRYLYYGDLFPNTYYVKAGLSSYYVQGIKYFLYTMMWSPGFVMLLLFPPAAFFAFKKRYIRLSVPAITFIRDSGIAYLLIFYTIRLGGDFMAFRFFLPSIFILALFFHFTVAENADEFRSFILSRIQGKTSFFNIPEKILSPSVIAFFLLLSFWPVPLHMGFVGDERRLFMKDMTKTDIFSTLFSESHPWGDAGKKFRKFQDCLQYEDFWITNSQAHASCMKGVGLGYFGVNAGYHIKILDEQAIPNPEIALQPVLMRFRPGHEHYITMTDVIKKGAVFCSSGEPAYDRIMRTNPGIVIKFDPELLATIPGIRSKLEKLLTLKKSGSNMIPRLERRYNTTLEDLIRQSASWEKDPVMIKKNQCWQNFSDDTSKFFY